MRAEITYAGTAVGWLDWQADGFGAQVTVDCAVPPDAPPLLRCWGETNGAPLLVGLPAPADGRLRLRRRLTRETLKAAGCTDAPPTAFYLSVQPQAARGPVPPALEPPAPQAAVPVQTGDAVLDGLLGQGAVRAERRADGVRLRCAFASDRPFALAPAFVLCRVEGDEAVLDWTKKDAAGAAASQDAGEIT